MHMYVILLFQLFHVLNLSDMSNIWLLFSLTTYSTALLLCKQNSLHVNWFMAPYGSVVSSQEGNVLLGVDMATLQGWDCFHQQRKEMSGSRNTRRAAELPYGLLASTTREMSTACLFTKKGGGIFDICAWRDVLWSSQHLRLCIQEHGILLAKLHWDSPANVAFFPLLFFSLLAQLMLKRSGAHMEESHFGQMTTKQ